ncbi:MAG: sigma-70 family RNA polymerase sigma factor [Clostridia bacterium]|nr:sigma-70 family RNA polymerase sigma factor [Clostridia bacterium]
MEDSKIVDLFFERSEQALTELSYKYENLSKKIAVNILGNNEDVLECINDSYLGIWNTIPPHRPDSLKYYFLRIVRNNAIARFHFNTAKKRNSFYDVSLQELEECLPAENNITRKLLSDEITSLLNSFLESQNRVNRIIFVRRYYFSDSVTEISERVKLTENNVSVRLNRMRKILKNHLEKEGIEI